VLLPQEEAEQLTPEERMAVASKVEDMYHQAYGVTRVSRKGKKVIVEVELDDRTRHDVVISSSLNP
jgi:hypothetical protein